MDERKPNQWRLDPGDVRRHAQRVRQAERVGPLGKLLRYAVGALALAGAFAVYWNFDTLRELRVDLGPLARVFGGDASGDGRIAPFSAAEPEGAVVEAAGVVGVAAPTSLGGEEPAAEITAVETSPSASPAAEPAPLAPVAPPEPPPAPEPELPVTPETFAFGLPTINVSEADASAAVVVLRSGGRRGVSAVTWWTTDGTATAGTDYASLGPLVVQFRAGEQNRTINIPIIGDRNMEGPETFSVHLAPGETADTAGESVEKLEVVINDDD